LFELVTDMILNRYHFHIDRYLLYINEIYRYQYDYTVSFKIASSFYEKLEYSLKIIHFQKC